MPLSFLLGPIIDGRQLVIATDLFAHASGFIAIVAIIATKYWN